MTSIFSERWLNVIFEGRNKEYGAYELRKITERNILIALIISVSLFALAIASPVIIKMLASGEEEARKIKIIEDVTLLAPPPIDPSLPPPPPPPPPPPLKTTIKFTPPEIVKDEEVTEEDEPPAIEELKEAESGAKTEEGDSSGVDLSLIDVGEDVLGDVSDEVFTIVEQMPEFPGGDRALVQYLTNITYPPIAKENDIEGVVHVRFVVEKTGEVTKVEVAKGTDKILNDAAVNHISKMPNWKPGRQRGKEVRVQYVVPIKFRLE